MKWNEVFKIVGPHTKEEGGIRQSKKGYKMTLKTRTIFKFKKFSFECRWIDLGLNGKCTLVGDDIKEVDLDFEDTLKVYPLP